jgi:UDP-N-acetylmuramate dehydrogenase
MVIDPADPHSRSVGSFFMNPVVSPEAAQDLAVRWKAAGHADAPPVFPSPAGVKIPAAWLVEHAGFPRGTRRGGVGVSAHHALALVNYGGTAAELLTLAGEIRHAVEHTFGIRLEPEPVVPGGKGREGAPQR